MQKIFVGLSGGVDSAVAAYLLKKEGHDVVGAFIKGWEPDFLPCTGAEDRLSAMRVAAHLEIPFVTYDLSKEYKKLVVDPFVAEYKAGRTPNPDVMCNRTIKFGEFWKKAKADGADFIATGHYAQVRGTRNQELGTSADFEKDQTYFLWTLTKDDLSHTKFPIGRYTKREIRKIAASAGLPNATRPDSQGLCFLGHVDMHEFLSRFIKPKTGMIYHTEGAVVGEHDGAWYYTIGQHAPVAGGKRLYVVGKDVKKNILTVTESPHPERGRTSLRLVHASWVSGRSPQGPILAQYRYHGPMVRATVRGTTVQLSEPISVASGQSLVMYSADGSICEGGGTIG